MEEPMKLKLSVEECLLYSNYIYIYILGSITSNDKREVLNDSEDFSNESTLESTTAGENHRAILHIDLGNEEKARIICRTLAVDKEPSRSTAKRTYNVQGHHLAVEIVSLDAKYLQKSVDNLFDMYYLARQTIDEVTRYHLQVSNSFTDTLDRSGKSRNQ
ncbi:hypothetical protein WUBG_03734 [Wuchereria bancrofti]|uniref:L antigen family member 3 n=1 Tax=Wuchereria bancrofti TaxID=6293 RepID=J9F745_WUCBA|nr:hypothetical protein WUBG_03734 [Wuchereria bancrofti]VDM19340.1 unnamed protein product [Wuchereria bancrofti]